jgi:hypothetical protein
VFFFFFFFFFFFSRHNLEYRSNNSAVPLARGMEPLLPRANSLLSRAGFSKRFDTLEQFASNASSFFVAVYESVFSSAISGIIRRPDPGKPAASYAHNAQRVIDSLRDILPPRVVFPESLTGAAVAGGDLGTLAFLVSVLDDAAGVVGDSGGLLGSVRGAPLTPAAKDALSSLGESHVASAASAASAVAGIASPLSPSTAATEQENEAWLAGADTTAGGGGSNGALISASSGQPAAGDIWSGSTPQKLKEKAAVKSALQGGSTKASITARSSASSSVTTSSSSGSRLAAAPPSVLSPSRRPSTATAASKTSSAAAPSPLGPTAASAPRPPPPQQRSTPKPSNPQSDALSQAGTEATGATRSSHLAEEIKALDARRAAAAAAMSIRQRAGVIRRMALQNKAELEQINTLTEAAIKSREAATRLEETKAIKAQEARAAAAKHERKVIALRTQGVIENLMRNTLSMRIARSSRQQAASAAMLKTLAAQARLGAAEDLRAAASQKSSMLLNAQSRMAWLNHSARLMNEAVLEETARQVQQRKVATLAQRDALERAMRDLRVEEDKVIRAMQTEQEHAEAAFQATHVEPLSRAAENREGLATAKTIIRNPTDTDADAGRVRTLGRLQEGLGRAEAARGSSLRAATAQMHRAAEEAGQGEAEVRALTEQAEGLMAAAGRA